MYLPIRELLICGPLCHERSDQTGQESSAVKEHVEGVGNETETVGPHTIEKLDEGKGEIQTEKEKEVTCGWV